MRKHILLFPFLFVSTLFAQTPDELGEYFKLAAGEFDVPQPVLESIAYVQSKWHQITYTDAQLANRPSDVQPPAFGVMGLRDDGWFGHSLTDAAALLDESPRVLRDSAYDNIRGAAALLSKYRHEANIDSLTVTGDPSTWAGVIARFSGIPQKDIAQKFAYHVLQTIQIGVNEHGIVIPAQRVNLDNFPESVKKTGYLGRKMQTSGVTGGADYPGATWNPSQNYGTRDGAPVVFVIIHDTEGPFDASVSWLQNPASSASSHYIIRSSDGYIEQLVHDTDMAWAVRCWNPITLSIEHEGYVSDSSYFTQTMYESSARLTEYLCREFNIPEDSIHIFGHDAWTYPWFNLIPFYAYTSFVGGSYATCNSHTDPGKYWKWHHYFDLIHAYDTTKPAVASVAPAGGSDKIPAYAIPTVSFNVPMNPQSVDSACTVSPNIPGGPSMSQDGTHLSYPHAGSLLAWSTTYTITIDTLARATNGARIASPFKCQFTTVPIDTTGPAVVTASPRNGGHSVSKAYVEFVMNEPVQYNSLPSKIAFTDSTGKSVGFAKDQFLVTSGNLTLIALRSMSSLTPGMKYTVSLAPGLIDPYGNLSKTTYSTTFTVDTSEATGGTVIEGFEYSSGTWLQPSASSLTTGVDTSLTGFGVSPKSYDGNDAGVLRYSFNSPSALCAVENSQGFDISSSGALGLWVFGDNSGNELDLIFGASARKLIPVDTLNWYGWKYIGRSRNKSDASTDDFRGFAVRHIETAFFDSSTIYVDDIQEGGKAEEALTSPPSSFTLLQNYPNPFNPTTTISYELWANSFVSLRVYDVLGREVATLVNGPQNAGSHSVTFDAAGLASGIYFYRINAGNYRLAKKMVVVK